MNRIAIAVAALALWSGAMFGAGWAWRGDRAEGREAGQRAAGAEAVAAQVSKTRATEQTQALQLAAIGAKHEEEATWRMLYQGVQPTKSTTAQVRDATGFAEAWSEIDEKLYQLTQDKAGLRLSEAQAFLEGLNQAMATSMFYGDQATSPAKFTGLAPRFNKLATSGSGAQIIDAGGTGSDNTSIWFLVWGENTVHSLYPKGSKAGVTREDKGVQTKTNPDGSVYDVVREKFQWDSGGIYASLSVAQATGVALTVDVKRNGTSILSTKLTFDNNERGTTTAAIPAVYEVGGNILAKGDEITIDVVQVGTALAKGLRVYLVGQRAN